MNDADDQVMLEKLAQFGKSVPEQNARLGVEGDKSNPSKGLIGLGALSLAVVASLSFFAGQSVEAKRAHGEISISENSYEWIIHQVAKANNMTPIAAELFVERSIGKEKRP